MYEQAYHGSCPEGDPNCFEIRVKLSSPHDVEYTDQITIGCPLEALGGDDCPDGGHHTLTSITLQEYAAFGADDE